MQSGTAHMLMKTMTGPNSTDRHIRPAAGSMQVMTLLHTRNKLQQYV